VGAHEYLLKPVSMKTLRERIAAVLCQARPIVHRDGYYGPQPRRAIAATAERAAGK
jgi:DNA-binding response OmpR family regulator